MKAAEIARHKRRLQELRAEILREGDLEIEPVRKDPAGVGADLDEQPHVEMQQVIASNRNRTRSQTLARIDKALVRLAEDAEMFGMCAECEEPIGKRLVLMPYVELCLACQQNRDGQNRPGGRKHLLDFE